MSEMDAMRGRANRLTGLNLERMRGISSRLNTDTMDTGVWLSVDSITADDSIQVRVGRLNAAKVASYTEALKAGAEFPAVDVFRDGDVLYLADGFHRLAAHIMAGKPEILAVVRPGGYDAAFEHAENANLEHGLELSMSDKKNIYFRRMARGYWDGSKDSLRQVAKAFGVDHTTLSRWRREYETGVVTDEAPITGVANAPLAEEYEKPQKASAPKKSGRKPVKKRAPTSLQLRQRALKNLRAAAEAFAGVGESDEAAYLEERADEWASHWELD